MRWGQDAAPYNAMPMVKNAEISNARYEFYGTQYLRRVCERILSANKQK
jgi:hypothetical protein